MFHQDFNLNKAIEGLADPRVLTKLIFMSYIVYSDYGHIQGIVKDENDLWFDCSIKTTGIGQDPIARFDTKAEAEAATNSHYNKVAKVKYAGLLRDQIGWVS